MGLRREQTVKHTTQTQAESFLLRIFFFPKDHILFIFKHSLIKSNSIGEDLCIFTSFHFPDSGFYLLNSFDFYFDLIYIFQGL